MQADKPSLKEKKHFAKSIHPCINSANYWFVRCMTYKGKCESCKNRVSCLECGLEYHIWVEVPSLALSRCVTCTRHFISLSLSFLICKVEINTGSPEDEGYASGAEHCPWHALGSQQIVATVNFWISYWQSRRAGQGCRPYSLYGWGFSYN